MWCMIGVDVVYSTGCGCVIMEPLHQVLQSVQRELSLLQNVLQKKTVVGVLGGQEEGDGFLGASPAPVGGGGLGRRHN